MSRAGALPAARFSFMPNRLACGGREENHAFLEYLADVNRDLGRREILRRLVKRERPCTNSPSH